MAARQDKAIEETTRASAASPEVREKLGLIAGQGRFPISLAQAARDRGYEVVAVAIESEASRDLEAHVDRIFWIGAGRITDAIRTFHEEGVSELVLAGKVQKGRIFDLTGVERELASAVERLTSRGDDAVLRVIVAELERNGLKVRESASFMGPFIPQKGVLTQRQPDSRQERDIVLGVRTARQMADLGIGQTVVVKSGVVVAVEALEGTDATILRAGQCGGVGTIVVKVSGPNQDLRFDLPAVGLRTLETLSTARCAVLAVEAGRTVVLDRAEVVRQADALGLVLVAI